MQIELHHLIKALLIKYVNYDKFANNQSI